MNQNEVKEDWEVLSEALEYKFRSKTNTKKFTLPPMGIEAYRRLDEMLKEEFKDISPTPSHFWKKK
jgi:hypothetical protein